MDKIANFSRLSHNSLKRLDHDHKKTKPNIEINDQKASESCE